MSPKYIKPFSVPNTRVAPMKESEFGFANIPAGAKTVIDTIAWQHMRIAGTPIDYFALNKNASQVDPVYGEAPNKSWIGPYHIYGHVVWPEPRAEMREEGFHEFYMSLAWISRLEFEKQKIPFPNRADIVRFWNIPYFEQRSVDSQSVPVDGYYYNIVNLADDGHHFNNPDFVGFRFELRRDSSFSPERRITPP